MLVLLRFMNVQAVLGNSRFFHKYSIAHVCHTCKNLLHAFNVYEPGKELGGEKFERYGAGGYCKPCAHRM